MRAHNRQHRTQHLEVFEKWIKEYGAARLAAEMNIHRTTVFKWLDGHCPRPEQMTRIRKLSKGRIGYATIIEGVQESRR